MTNRIEPSKTAEFNKRTLVDGNRAGKLPVPTGRWVWPTAVVALGIASLWGAKHVEKQVELAAPGILQATGIDASTLQFDASYRNVEVSGVLPANSSAGQIEMTLAKYSGADGESIRQATVAARPQGVTSPEQAAITPNIAVNNNLDVQPEPMLDNVRVSATVDHDTFILSGTVPTQSDVDVLYDAAQQSITVDNIVNKLSVSGASSTPPHLKQSINDMATVLSNFDDNILDAQIDLDDDLITGNITTANDVTTNKIRAFLPTAQTTTLIGIITDSNLPADIASPEGEVIQEQLITKELDSNWAEVEPVEPTEPAELEPLDTQSYATDQLATDQIVFEPIDETIVESAFETEHQPLDDDFATDLQNELDQLAADIEANVVFPPSSDQLMAQATSVLDRVVTVLNNYPAQSIEIGGHTDSQSSSAYNLQLSQNRAQAVVNYLVLIGVDSTRLSPMGYGESQPIASNDTSAGRARNRRVELRVN